MPRKAVLNRLVQSFQLFKNLEKQFSYKFHHVNIELCRFLKLIYVAKRIDFPNSKNKMSKDLDMIIILFTLLQQVIS